MSPGQLIQDEQPDRVRVTWSGEQYELESPMVQADSLVGLIVERGSHVELIAAGGRYARMWQRQIEGKEDLTSEVGSPLPEASTAGDRFRREPTVPE